MYDTLNKFVKKIKNGESKYITKIIRIKNGFNNILTWKTKNDCKYCDFKLNVIVLDTDSNIAMIGEIQLLLQWQILAKKMGYV